MVCVRCLTSCTQADQKALPKNATLLLCSTVPASYAQSVASELQAHGRGDIKFIDCPVSGGAKRAADGTLSIMAGGSDEALESGKFLLQAMSGAEKLYLVPGGVGAGSNMKMVHQVLAAIQILGASEVMGFAARLGLDVKQAGEKIKSSEGWSWMHENRLPRMLAEDWNPGASALTIILKDVVCRYACVLMHADLLGHYHYIRSTGALSDSALLHSRTDIPRSSVSGLRRKGRLGYGAPVLS